MEKEHFERDNSMPLVSILVVTYNSAEFVLETLESAKKQTYKNIELIITDDGSRDETVSVCESWLLQNKDRFVRTQLITVPQNTGIPANCNRGVKASNGEWIKIIAGDDILLDSCIDSFVGYVKRVPEAKAIQGLVKVFWIDEEGYPSEGVTLPLEKQQKIFQLSVEKQFQRMYLANYVAAPGVFLNRQLLIQLHYFDERFTLLEDVPMWLKMLYNDTPFYLFEEVVALYRVHSKSVMGTQGSYGQHNAIPYPMHGVQYGIALTKMYRRKDVWLSYYRNLIKYKYFEMLGNSGIKKNIVTDFINRVVNKIL